jgi:glyoxylase-like metal-dependent hydrolase (beta-lactamase superfamily II)
MMGKNYTLVADEWIGEGEYPNIINTPGHTAGSICLYFADDNVLFSGDTLFWNSFGRTDLPTGDMKKLISSIKNQLFILPDDTVVYPGHGPKTSIEREKRVNMINGY